MYACEIISHSILSVPLRGHCCVQYTPSEVVGIGLPSAICSRSDLDLQRIFGVSQAARSERVIAVIGAVTVGSRGLCRASATLVG